MTEDLTLPEDGFDLAAYRQGVIHELALNGPVYGRELPPGALMSDEMVRQLYARDVEGLTDPDQKSAQAYALGMAQNLARILPAVASPEDFKYMIDFWLGTERTRQGEYGEQGEHYADYEPGSIEEDRRNAHERHNKARIALIGIGNLAQALGDPTAVRWGEVAAGMTPENVAQLMHNNSPIPAQIFGQTIRYLAEAQAAQGV